MIQLQLLIALAKQFWKPIVAVLLIVLCAWFIVSWRERGIRLEAAKAEIKNATELARKWHDVAQECSAGVLKLEAENKRFKADLDAALAATPVEVIRYRDRVQVVHDTVLSDDCPTAVMQIAELMSGTDYCEATP